MGLLLPIYMYHQVLPLEEMPSDKHLYLTPEVLEQQINQLRASGHEFITLSKAFSKNTEQKRDF